MDNSSNHIFIAFFGNFSQIFFCVLMSVNFWYNTYNLKRQINPNYLFAQPMSNEYGDHVTRLDQWGLEESINRNDPKSCNKLRPIESQESGSDWVRHKKKLFFLFFTVVQNGKILRIFQPKKKLFLFFISSIDYVK